MRKLERNHKGHQLRLFLAITEEKIKLISEAGAAAVAIGLESGHEEFRKKTLDRRTPQGKVIEAFRLAKKYGIHTHAFNMVGLPEETNEVIQANLELINKIQPDSFQVTIFYPLQGTALHDFCIKKGYLNNSIFNLNRFWFIFS